MKRLLLAILPAALLACRDVPRTHYEGSPPSQAPVGSPPWIMDQFYAWTTFPSESLYLSPEFTKLAGNTRTIGGQLQPDVSVVNQQILLDSTHAVYRTTVRSVRGPSEYYTYLGRAGGKGAWQIDAVRAVQFPNSIYNLIDSLKAGQKLKDAPTTLLGILQLSVSSDSDVKEYLRKNTDAVAAIAEAFQSQPDLSVVDIADSLSRMERRGTPVHDPHADVRKLLDHALISAVFRMTQYPGCVFVRIGGMNSRQLGYIYAPDGCKLPSMSPARFMLVDPIKPHWYEYKAQ